MVIIYLDMKSGEDGWKCDIFITFQTIKFYMKEYVEKRFFYMRLNLQCFLKFFYISQKNQWLCDSGYLAECFLAHLWTDFEMWPQRSLKVTFFCLKSHFLSDICFVSNLVWTKLNVNADNLKLSFVFIKTINEC